MIRAKSAGRVLVAVLGLSGLAAFGLVVPVTGQAPPDSAQVVDSLAASDSLVADSLQVPDSLAVDTIFHNLPEAGGRVPAGYATGVWEWDRHAIMATGANTLGELLREVPGVVLFEGGDYGTPTAASAFGQGGAAYRVFRDGFELYPVDGGVVDLQRVGLVGVQRVRLDRSLGQMIIELRSHRYDDGRPFSVVEAGTGDLDTNMFRGVYADPTALFGSVAGGLERIDTRGRGPTRDEGGNRTGTWVRYQFHLGDRAGVGLDFRRVAAQTKVAEYPPSSTRSDLFVRASAEVVSGVVLEAYTGRSSYDIDGDTLAFDPRGGTRSQHGARLGVEVGPAWVTAAARLFEGDLPERSLDARGGLTSERWGGVAGSWTTSRWNGTTMSSFGARVWTAPVLGASLFGAYEAGDFGARSASLRDRGGRPPLVAPTGPQPGTAAITERETLRVGGTISLRGVTLAGAALYAHSDLALPFGTELDAGAIPVSGVHRRGYESFAVLPTLWEGLSLQGSYQWWDEDGPYLPAQVYRGAFEYHRVFKESGNLEFWASLGVRGYDPMPVFLAGAGSGSGALGQVPFHQSWFARIQVRVVTVRLWLGMDNFTFRRNNQTVPGRLLPYARSFFALRWDMWN